MVRTRKKNHCVNFVYICIVFLSYHISCVSRVDPSLCWCFSTKSDLRVQHWHVKATLFLLWPRLLRGASAAIVVCL